MQQYPVLTMESDCDRGLVLQAFEQVWLDTEDRKYLEYIQNNIDWFVESAYRPNDHNLADLNSGRSLFRLYQKTGDARYQQAIELLRRQIKEHPRTSEGGFWHSKSCSFQMWLDDAYMAGPFYAAYGRTFGETAAFDDVAHQILLIERHTRDSKTGLFYRAWDESKMQAWANPKTGCSSQFSARAMGWYAMALVDVLDILPASHQARDRMITIMSRMMHSITLAQDQTTGLWHQVLDGSGHDASELDTATSCMFVYSMAKGFRMGFLNSSNLTVAQKGFAGIIEHLTKCLKIGDTNSFPRRMERWQTRDCESSRESHILHAPVTTVLTAIGAFMLASTEIHRLSIQG